MSREGLTALAGIAFLLAGMLLPAFRTSPLAAARRIATLALVVVGLAAVASAVWGIE